MSPLEARVGRKQVASKLIYQARPANGRDYVRGGAREIRLSATAENRCAHAKLCPAAACSRPRGALCCVCRTAGGTARLAVSVTPGSGAASRLRAAGKGICRRNSSKAVADSGGGSPPPRFFGGPPFGSGI